MNGVFLFGIASLILSATPVKFLSVRLKRSIIESERDGCSYIDVSLRFLSLPPTSLTGESLFNSWFYKGSIIQERRARIWPLELMELLSFQLHS